MGERPLHAWHRARRQAVRIAEATGAAEPLRGLKALVSPSARRAGAELERLELLLSRVLRGNDNCVDVGANRGVVLASMIRGAPRGRHIAFEPVPFLRDELARRFPGVDVRGCALSDREGQADFQVVYSMPSWSRLVAAGSMPDAEIIRVRTARLDAELPSGYVPAILKIDVEGAELAVLRGAHATLAQHHPLVVFEQGALMPGQTAEIFQLLTELRYRVFDLRGRGPYAADGFVEAARDPSIIDFLARPG